MSVDIEEAKGSPRRDVTVDGAIYIYIYIYIAPSTVTSLLGLA